MGELRQVARGTPAPEWRRIIDVPSPAANTAVTIPAQAKRAWRVMHVTVLATVAVAVANRLIRLVHADEAGVPLGVYPISTALTSGQTTQVTWAAGVGSSSTTAGTAAIVALPTPFYVLPGETLTLTGLGNAADTFTKTRVTVIETYTGDAVHELNAEQAIVDHWNALNDLFAAGGKL